MTARRIALIAAAAFSGAVLAWITAPAPHELDSAGVGEPKPSPAAPSVDYAWVKGTLTDLPGVPECEVRSTNVPGELQFRYVPAIPTSGSMPDRMQSAPPAPGGAHDVDRNMVTSRWLVRTSVALDAAGGGRETLYLAASEPPSESDELFFGAWRERVGPASERLHAEDIEEVVSRRRSEIELRLRASPR